MAALFQSITPRTAGLATVDYNDLHPITLFITIILCLLGQVLTLQGAVLRLVLLPSLSLASRTLFNNRSDTEVLNVVSRWLLYLRQMG